MKGAPSVHLIFRRGGHASDRIVELAAQGLGQLKIEADVRDDTQLVLRLTLGIEADLRGRKNHVEQAADEAKAKGSVHDLNGGVGRVGNDGLLVSPRIVGQGLPPGYVKRLQDNLNGRGASSASAVPARAA